MSGRSAGGLVLLLIGALALIGYLTGNLDRWLAFLFVPPGSPAASSSTGAAPAAPSVALTLPPGANQRGAVLVA